MKSGVATLSIRLLERSHFPFALSATSKFKKGEANMAIRFTSDVGAPLAVTAVNIVSRTSIPEYHDWIIYAITAAGYLGASMGWGGDFLKQMGVSSLPLTADKIYERVKGGAGASSRLAYRSRSVARYPAQALEAPFQGVRLT